VASRWVVPAVVLGVLGSAACGSDGRRGPSTDVRVVAAAPAAMAKVRSCRVSITWNALGMPPVPEQGVIDFAHNRAMLNASVPNGPDGKRATVLELFDGSTVYFKGLPGTDSDPSKQWTSAQLSGRTAYLDPAGSNPITSFAVLSIHGSVEVIGQERVRGVATAHFREHLPMGGKPAQQDMWVDKKGLIRRLVVAGTFGTAVSGQFTSTQEYYDFGTSASISIPPPSQIMTLPSSTADPARP